MNARSPSHNGQYRLLRVLVVASLLLLALFVTHLVTRGAELPPRPSPEQNVPPRGASMQLRGRFPGDWPFDQIHWQYDLWLVVQWQDGGGGWHDVGGWQGNFDAIYFQDQWVAQRIFWADDPLLGSGPYRWLVVDTKNHRVAGVSAPYYLPTNAGNLVIIDLIVTP